MADFSKMRRKQTAWPGFFSSNAPVRTLPAVELDEDAEVYQRVKHLQHLRAIHEAMEETGPLDTERPGYNPHLTDLFGDEAVRTIEAAGNDPFFLSLHFTAPHWPWEGREDAEAAKTIGMSFDPVSEGTYFPARLFPADFDLLLFVRETTPSTLRPFVN